MSLQRYAILAAVSQHQLQQQQQKQQQHNTTILTTFNKTTMETTTLAPALPFSAQTTSVEEDSQEEYGSSSQQSSSSSTSSFTTYYSGGLGLYHQQHQRGAGGGINLLNGGPGSINGATGPHTYANVVNGNVNLLLGGAMLSLVTTILCVVCYCCHRNIKKRTEAAYRQQRQWLENDPNMEIYSVEQCYETSGLFLGDSSDGLATLPTLHHEPPPSYDAVVLHEQQQQQLLQQQQQQQQLHQQQLHQQLLLQRVSPPPGYHSTLDISHLTATTCGRGTPDGMALNERLEAGNSTELCAAGSSGSNIMGTAASSSNAANKQLAALNMKRVLNAQSCCSLQRAEVENMWNAAAAAVAARSGNCLELETYTPPAMQQRKLAQAAGTRFNTFGRRYLQQSHQHSHYRRGCPLCGKFRYEAEDALMASTESGLDMGSAARELSPTERFTQALDNNDNVEEQQQPTVAEASATQLPMNAECFCTNGNTYERDTTAVEAADATNGNLTNEPPSVEVSSTDENDNAATGATSATPNTATNDNLDSINDNGIISLDMSKIIDRSGLPTYEGALKLESSGYV